MSPSSARSSWISAAVSSRRFTCHAYKAPWPECSLLHVDALSLWPRGNTAPTAPGSRAYIRMLEHLLVVKPLCQLLHPQHDRLVAFSDLTKRLRVFSDYLIDWFYFSIYDTSKHLPAATSGGGMQHRRPDDDTHGTSSSARFLARSPLSRLRRSVSVCASDELRSDSMTPSSCRPDPMCRTGSFGRLLKHDSTP